MPKRPRKLRGDPGAFHYAWLAAAFDRGTLALELLGSRSLSISQLNDLAIQALQHQSLRLLQYLWSGLVEASPGCAFLSRILGQVQAHPHLPTGLDEPCAYVARCYEEGNYVALAILVRFWVRFEVSMATLWARGYMLPEDVCTEIMRQVWANFA